MTKFQSRFSIVKIAGVAVACAFAGGVATAQEVGSPTTNFKGQTATLMAGNNTATTIGANSITLNAGNGSTDATITANSQGQLTVSGRVNATAFATNGANVTTINNDGVNIQGAGKLTVGGVDVGAKLTDLNTRLGAEATARIDQDNRLSTSIQSTNNALASEAATRAAQDAHQTLVNGTQNTAIYNLQQADIASGNRMDTIETVNTQQSAAITALTSVVATKASQADLTNEVNRAKAAEVALGGRIDATNAKVANNTKRIDNIEKVGVAIAINTIVNDALPQEVKDAGISLSASTGGINVVKQLEGGAHVSVGANGVSLGASKDLNDNVRVHGGVGTEGASVGLYVHEKGNGVGISTSGPSVMINNHAIPLTPQGFVVSAITGAYKNVTGKTAKEISSLKSEVASFKVRAEKAEATAAMQAEAIAKLQEQIAAIVAAQAK